MPAFSAILNPVELLVFTFQVADPVPVPPVIPAILDIVTSDGEDMVISAVTSCVTVIECDKEIVFSFSFHDGGR